MVAMSTNDLKATLEDLAKLPKTVVCSVGEEGVSSPPTFTLLWGAQGWAEYSG